MSCTTCGAVLDRHDRYCPACDAPNTHGRFFGKFRPRFSDLELAGWFDSPDLIAPDELECPRCDALVARTERWCGACGLDLDVVRPIMPRDSLQGAWHSTGPDVPDPYRSLRVPGLVFRLSLMLASATFAVTAVLYVLWFLRTGAELPSPSIDVVAVASWVSQLSLVSLGVGILALAAAVLWTGRACRNLPALQVRGARFSPEIVGAAWLVPGINLVIPKLVLDELWRGSDPRTSPGTRRWRRLHAPTILHVGWIALLAGVGPAVMVALAPPVFAGSPPSELRLRLALGVASNACLLLATSSLTIVVGQIGERQAERAERLGPASIPPLHDRLAARQPRVARRSGAARPAAATPSGTEAAPVTPSLRRVGTSAAAAGRY